jgi:hypothetical protein
VLTGLSARNRDAFEEMAEGAAHYLDATDEALRNWWNDRA